MVKYIIVIAVVVVVVHAMISLLKKKNIVNLPVYRLKTNLKLISSNSSSPLRAQNVDIGAATQT